jgi:transcriptional regulator with XRE-family HTH domain
MSVRESLSTTPYPESGLSQENFAKSSGVSRAHMGRIENARHAVNIDTLENIAIALDVDAAELLRPLTDKIHGTKSA